MGPMQRAACVLGVVAFACAACSGGDPRGEPVTETAEAVSVCPTTVVEGIDVYDGQGAIDWAKVKADGRDFGFMKATQGDYNTQTTFAANWSGAKAAGVVRSPYHFFDPTIDGVKQAQHFLATLAAQGGLRAGDLAPMLDIECPTSSTQASASPDCEYTGNSGWAPPATLAQRAFDWLTTVEQATGRKPFVYSYPSWFGDVAFTDARLAQYPLFIATLATCASVPAPWATTVFWQYSFTGTVSGIAGQVDLDRFVGTLGQLQALGDPPVADGGTDAAARDASPGGDAAAADAAVESGASLEAGSPGGDGAAPVEASAASSSGSSGSSDGCGCRLAAPPMGRTSGLAGLAAVLALASRRLRRRSA